MTRYYIIILLFFCLWPSGSGQSGRLERYEFTGGAGITQFFGDIGGYPTGQNTLGLKDITYRNTRYNISLGIRYWLLNNISARFETAYGAFHSTDSYGSNKSRGFSSTTKFLEPSLKGEFHLIRNMEEYNVVLKDLNNYTLRSFIHLIDPYIFAGIAGLYYYKVSPNEALAPLATAKGGFTPVIPAGIGINLIYSWDFNLGLELGGRYSLSDNIDGFTSATSKAKDIYYFLNLVVTWKIRKD
jgi:hypothetical protein